MFQFAGYLSEKFGKVVHKVIFIEPLDEKGHFQVIKQRYVDVKDKSLIFRKGKKEFPLFAADWSYLRGQTFVQFRSWESAYKLYQFHVGALLIVPDQSEVDGEVVFHEIPQGAVLKQEDISNVRVVSSKELDADRRADDLNSMNSNSMDAGMLLLIVTAVAAVMGGIIIGYLGLPAAMGQTLVKVTPAPVIGAGGLVTKFILGV